MSSTLEDIIKEISSLPAAERFSLWRELGMEFTAPFSAEDATAEGVEAAWDEEIDSRVKEVESGTVELVSSEEVDRRTKALFLDLGLTRKDRPA